MTTFTNFSGTTRLLLSDTARTASFDEIPLISLPPPSPNPTAATPPSLIAAIRDACTRVGFFYLADHGVPESTVDQAFEYARKFFDQTKDDKAEVHIRKSRTMRGWEPIKEPGSDDEVTGDRKRDPTRRADLKETFCWAYEESLDPEVVGKKRDADGKLCAGDNPMSGDNLWPSSPPGFRAAMTEYYSAVLALSRRLLRIFALALDLPETHFDATVSKPGALANILHYPPQAPTDMTHIGINAHTDFECFTILCQSPQAGLQVLNPAGEWIMAPPIPNTFVVNVGDMLERWSNDIFKSTVHRVINVTGEERYSIPFFFGPNYDTVVAPLASCVGEGRRARYEPILAGDYVFRRLDEVYGDKKKKEEEEEPVREVESTPARAVEVSV